MFCYKSPAKVNLDLKILSKREDGFHEMSTLMAPLDLHDEIRFEKGDGFQLICDYPGVPLDESNLVTKALRILERQASQTFSYKITIEKLIPHGAGLAGGSSNAATTLLAINELEQLGFSIAQLAEMAADLGSDVAFFLYQSVCRCSGRGEIVKPVDLSIQSDVLLVKPSFGVSTPKAYQAWANSSEIEGIDYTTQAMPWGEMVNDLERPVYEKHRFLAELKMWLLQREEVNASMMSGSGSTIFALTNGDVSTLKSELLQFFDPKLWLCESKIL